MPMALAFNEIQFDIIDRENRPWLRLYQIGSALGYEKPEVSVSQLYARHADEFTDTMTALVKLPSEGGEQETRIFSLRGCHLLAMLARTPIAKAFRKWVLDVLDKLAQEESNQPSTDSPITPDQQCTLRALVKARVEATPEDRREKGIYPQIWSRFNNHFRIARYAQLPQSRMSEAVAYLVKMDIAPKALKQGTMVMPPVEVPEGLEGQRKKIIEELKTLEGKMNLLFNQVRLNLHPGSVSLALPENEATLYATLCQLNYMATGGIYTARQAIATAWRIGKLGGI